MIISLSGRISSGKDTVANYLVEKYGFEQYSFAGTLKLAASNIFSWPLDMLEGKTSEARAQREEVDQWWAKRLNIPHLTPRWVLQNLGTDVLRTHFHNDIWIASLENKLRNVTMHDDKHFVISDSRFVNELSMLSDSGAITVMVERGNPPEWWETAKRAYYDPEAVKTMQMFDIHQSEWAWVGYDFDHTVLNTGTLQDLYSNIDNIVSRV